MPGTISRLLHEEFKHEKDAFHSMILARILLSLAEVKQQVLVMKKTTAYFKCFNTSHKTSYSGF